VRIYLDHSATTPVRPEVVDYLASLGPLGNPSSIHEEGRRARAVLERARERVAAWAGIDPAGVVFTSGGTEANALAIRSLARRAEREGRSRIAWMDGGSHAAVRENALALAGWTIETDRTAANSSSLHLLLGAHNESGRLADMGAALAAAARGGAFLHVDAVQIPGRLAFDPELIAAASIAISGHKIGGPMGAGALLMPSPFEVEPFWRGGGQEAGRRNGTPPLAAIAGLGAAIGLAYDANRARLLAARLHDGVALRLGENVREVSECRHGLAGTLLLQFIDTPGDVLAAALDASGVAASFGSACGSGTQKVSESLVGSGVPREVAAACVRFSIAPSNTEREIDDAAERIAAAWRRVREAGA
jgi:cysteine desulfurase